MFVETSQHFDLSTSHVMVSFAGTAQEAGAGGRSGQLVSLFTVHCWAVSLYVNGFLHFSLGPLWLSG